MNNVVENLEALVIEAHKNKGWKWVQWEPLWTTWSLEKFGADSGPSFVNCTHNS